MSHVQTPEDVRGAVSDGLAAVYARGQAHAAAAIVRRIRARAAELRETPVGHLGNATARVRALELERMADEIEGGGHDPR